MLEQLTFWLEELPVRDSASRESRAASAIPEAPSASLIAGFLELCIQDGSSGKMCRASLAPTMERTSRRSSEKLMKSGILARGECWTLNTSEWTDTLVPFRSDDAVCSLSDILESGDIPQKYYLSRDACTGILRKSRNLGQQSAVGCVVYGRTGKPGRRNSVQRIGGADTESSDERKQSGPGCSSIRNCPPSDAARMRAFNGVSGRSYQNPMARQTGGGVPRQPALQGLRQFDVRERHAMDRNENRTG